MLLVRHGLTAMTGPVLAGRTPGLHLDDRGWAQARAVAARLAVVPLAAVVSSPLDRCLDTASAITAGRAGGAAVVEGAEAGALEVEPRLAEVDYGTWTGRELKALAKEPLWRVVQAHPSAAVFPEGEGLAAVQARAVAAVRDWDTRLGADAVWVACAHGDVIKSVLADALGQHLDSFQRIVVDPCSVSVVTYTELRPFVQRVNDIGGSYEGLVPKPKRRGRRTAKVSSDAPVGGGGGD